MIISLKRNKLYPFILVLLLVHAIPLSAEYKAGELRQKMKRDQEKLKKYNNKKIDEVNIYGLKYSKKEYIKIISKLKKGKKFKSKKFIKSIQRLWNTQFFYNIDYLIEEKEDNTIKINLLTKDKWSFLPIIVYKSGGGIQTFRVGAYEGNLFGEFKKIGFYYDNINGEHFGRIWYEDRYLFDSHVHFRLDLYSDGYVNNYYKEGTDNILTQYTQRKAGISVSFDIPIIEDLLSFGIIQSLYYENIRQSSRSTAYPNLINSEQKNFNRISQLMFSNTLYLKLGQVNLLEDYYHDGQEISISYEFADKKILSDDNLSYLKVDSKLFINYLRDFTFGQHLVFQKSFNSQFYRDFAIGGLDEIRGFLGTRFHGQNVYFYNAEFRFPFYVGDVGPIKDFVSSLVVFYDMAYVWDGYYFSKTMFDDFYASSGLGLRLNIRRIKNAQLRIDFALPLRPSERHSLVSIGLFHFF